MKFLFKKTVLLCIIPKAYCNGNRIIKRGYGAITEDLAEMKQRGIIPRRNI